MKIPSRTIQLSALVIVIALAAAAFGAYMKSLEESKGYRVWQNSQCSGNITEITYKVREAPQQWVKRTQKVNGEVLTNQPVWAKGTNIVCTFLPENAQIRCAEADKKSTFVVTEDGTYSDFNRACPFVYRPEETEEDAWPFNSP